MGLDLTPSPTQFAFMEADAFCVGLEGPRGEGKTSSGIFRLLHKAAQLPAHVRPLRVAVIRDTFVNLRKTTIENVKELQRRGLPVQWRQDEAEAILGPNHVHLFFFGLDRLAEVNKLQGFKIGVLWLEEPAPAADISGGLPPEVFGVGATSLRQEGLRGWVQFTLNPPDADHWVVGVDRELRRLAPKYPELGTVVKWFHIPRGENRHVTDVQRSQFRIALEAIGRADLVGRLIEGRRGQVVLGERVLPEYNDDLHVADELLPILAYEPVVRMWDFGLTPVCIWSQTTPAGYWHILHAVQGVNQGVEELIEATVKPWEAQYLAGHRGGYDDVGDAAGWQREQRNANYSAARSVEEMLNTTFRAGPIQWPARRDALKRTLGRMIRGRPAVQVDPDCLLVRRAARAGWHYPKDGLGRITPTLEAAKRASGLHDHVGHAWAHGASVLFPLEGAYAKPPRRPASAPAPDGWRRELAWMSA